MLKGQKSFRSIVIALFVIAVSAFTASAQVDVTGSTGADGSYATLSAAFTAINGGVQTGNNIVVGISGNTTEPVGGAILNAGAWTTITISPTGGASRTISGAATAGLPLIDFNGADNVTIDGLNTGGNSLTIANTTVSATSGTSTIRFIGGATSNTITNCNIQGSGTMSVATNGATIFFSTDGNTANGNDNNTISNNNIGPAGANLPTKAILGNGSTTTTAIGNSGIVINNNNIFDYFGASVTSSGVATNGGCNTWSITNNRFYQTGTRTWTTGATHRAIDIGPSTATSGAQGFTITGNTVGYASNTQTGVYTLTGSTGKFQGIVFSGISAGTASTINNNTVAAVSMTGVTSSGTSTSSPLVGMLFLNGNFTGNNNTIGSQSSTGSIVLSTTTTLATDVYGMYNFTFENSTNTGNTVGGISVTNLGASGTFLVFGIRANTGTTLLWNASNNTIGGSVANSIQLNATGTSSQVTGLAASSAVATFNQNTIRNLTTNIGTGTTSSASVIGISTGTSTTPTHTISQNTIHTLTNTNATAASVVTGIHFTGSAGANVVERNQIYNLLAPTTSTTAEINGIRVGGGTTTYRNNTIALGANQAIAIGTTATNSSTAGINGFMGALGTDAFVHNSVYIGGTATSGSGNSYALNGTQTVNTRSFRDNIFQNSRTNSGATGKHYAVKINGTAANPTGLTINNNIYFANGTGGVFGFFNSLDVANLAAWKVAVGQDAGSFESNPQFNDPTNAVPDLHLHPTNPTVAEGNGVDVGVVLDFDGQTRSGLTPVDIGADAGNFVGIDLAGPTITYTPLLNTSSTSTRTLNVTITDNSGVASGGLAPRIYQRKTPPGGGYSSLTCTGASPNYTCTIDTAIIGTPAVADVIEYFIVAQDTVGNVSVSPSAGAVATDVLTVTTPPTTPSSYTIVGSASGSYNVGTGETYTSLTNAGGIFEFINSSEVTGNITLNITTDLAGELGTVALNEFASPYTILIKPSGAPRAITGSNTGALIRLNGADRVRIDGSTAASFADNAVGGNPALRELTIQNTNTGTSAVVISIGSNGANGAQNNTIQNVNVLGQDPTTSLLGISLGGASPGTTATGPNNGNRVLNNSVKRAIFGIYSAGQTAAPNTGTEIRENETSDVTGDRIRRVGILVFNENGVQITENSINGISTNESADGIGIGVGTQGVDTTTTTSGGVSNALVARNKINGVASLSTTGFSAAGITVAGGTLGANTIQNNMISGVTAPSTSPDFPAGIFVAGATGSITQLYHNSISMTGDRGTVNTQMPSYGVAITGTDPTVELKNNIFYTTQTAGCTTACPTAQSYAIGMASTAFTNLDANYNDFWSASGLSQDGGFRTGSLAVSAGTSYATLALWQAAVSDDANSIEANPLFISATNDLHLQLVSAVIGLGTPIGSVTVDYDNDPRPASAPDIGADEIVQSVGGVMPSGTFYNASYYLGDTLSGDVSVTNTLYLLGVTNGAGFTTTVGCNATVVGGSSFTYIDGAVRKDFCTTGAFDFPVGQNQYSKVNANVTALGTVPSSLTVTPYDATLGGFPPATSLSRNWNLEETGDLTADLLFYYDDADVNGTESDYRAYKRAGNGVVTDMCGGPCVDTVNNIIGPVSGVSSFSRWTGAGPLAPTAADVSLSGRVTTADGRGVTNAVIVLTGNALAQPMMVKTGSFGYYRFDNLEAGETYIVTVNSKRFIFSVPSRVVSVPDNVSNIDFVAMPE